MSNGACPALYPGQRYRIGALHSPLAVPAGVTVPLRGSDDTPSASTFPNFDRTSSALTMRWTASRWTPSRCRTRGFSSCRQPCARHAAGHAGQRRPGIAIPARSNGALRHRAVVDHAFDRGRTLTPPNTCGKIGGNGCQFCGWRLRSLPTIGNRWRFRCGAISRQEWRALARMGQRRNRPHCTGELQVSGEIPLHLLDQSFGAAHPGSTAAYARLRLAELRGAMRLRRWQCSSEVMARRLRPPTISGGSPRIGR